MELAHLIDALSRPEAYPGAVTGVEVVQTHISVVFLTDRFVYKLKKPVSLGFLDFSTLEKRRFYCAEEVRLNRRLAPSVYRGVVPIVQTPAGVRVDAPGDAIDCAVKMERLPEGASLHERLLRGEVDRRTVESLAQRIADFHRHAEGGPHIAEFGRFDVVAPNARDNFEQSQSHVGTTVSRAVFARLRALTEESLARLRPLIGSRALRGVPRDTHGDLHLDHIYQFPERPPPHDLIAIDCIEFNESLRCGDPIADSAFLAMDLVHHGRRDLANAFIAAYLAAAGDRDGGELFPFYMAYRAAVRGKVEGFEVFEPEVPEGERNAARDRARAHWLLALGELEVPARRPCLVLVAGLPGSGKSTLARAMADRGNFTVIRSDVVRKELAGLPPHASARCEPDTGLYTTEWNQRTYAECLRRAEAILFEGGRAIVDASFGRKDQRRRFLETAARWDVPVVLLLCRASRDVTLERLRNRRGDASDADTTTYERAVARWEELGPRSRAICREITTEGESADVLAHALDALRERKVY